MCQRIWSNQERDCARIHPQVTRHIPLGRLYMVLSIHYSLTHNQLPSTHNLDRMLPRYLCLANKDFQLKAETDLQPFELYYFLVKDVDTSTNFLSSLSTVGRTFASCLPIKEFQSKEFRTKSTSQNIDNSK